MTERGLRESETVHRKVVGSSLVRRGPRQHSDATTWMAIWETLLADARCLIPVVIFTVKASIISGFVLPVRGGCYGVDCYLNNKVGDAYSMM